MEKEKALVDALRSKTADGKLDWRRSASLDEYMAAVGGKQVYILRRLPVDDGTILQHIIQLEVRDSERDTTLYELEYPASGEPLELFQVIRQRANHVAERLNESLNLLNSL